MMTVEFNGCQVDRKTLQAKLKELDKKEHAATLDEEMSIFKRGNLLMYRSYGMLGDVLYRVVEVDDGDIFHTGKSGLQEFYCQKLSVIDSGVIFSYPTRTKSQASSGQGYWELANLPAAGTKTQKGC